MKNAKELTRKQLLAIVLYIQEILWADTTPDDETLDEIDIWDPDKEWEPNMLEEIALILKHNGLRPNTFGPRN